MDLYTVVEERYATVLMTACELNISMYNCLKANLLESETKHVLRYMLIVDMMGVRGGGEKE